MKDLTKSWEYFYILHVTLAPYLLSMGEITCLNYLQFTNRMNIPTFKRISIESDEGRFNYNSNQFFQNVGIFLQFTLCSIIIFSNCQKCTHVIIVLSLFFILKMGHFLIIRPNLVKSKFIPHHPDCRNIPTFLR